MRIPGVLLLLAAATLISAGCTRYTMKTQYRPGISTVAVPIWTRGPQVYRRELEMRLTEAIVKRIELDTPYKVTTKDRADTELTGRIMRIEQRVLSKNPKTSSPRELEVTFFMSYRWTDLRNGNVLVEHENFRVADTYITHEPLGEGFFQGSEAVINRIARRLVEQMEAEW